jgi:hypothetical protein
MIMCMLENSLGYIMEFSNPTLIAIIDCDRVLNIENHSEKILLHFLLKAKKKKKKSEFGFSDT